ncbi:MAG: TolC family protein [Bacteroidetes bacterium]|nr:TolC family protein [Bacteroidota bacterium]
MKKIFLFLTPFIFTAGIAVAQDRVETFSFSLPQAIEYAYQHQADVVNAQIDEQVSNAKVNEVIGMGLPQLSASFDLKDFEQLPTSLIPAEFFGGKAGEFLGIKFGTRWNATAGVNASQLIFEPSYLVGVQASKTYRELSQKNLTRTKIETAVSVSKAYYNVLVSRERMKLMEANMIRVQKLRDDTKALYDNGFVEKIDLDRIVLTYNNLSTEKENVSRLLILSEFMLRFQVGMDIHTNLVLTDSLNAGQIKNTMMNAEKPDVTKRIEYSLLKTQQHLQSLDLKRYKVQYVPSIVAYGSLSTSAQRNQFNIFDSDKKWYPTGIIGATFSWKLFDGLQRERKIDQAKLALKKVDNELQQVANALSLEAEVNRTSLTNALASFNTQQQNLDLANEVVRVSKAKYDQGVGSNLEVINAETSLKEAQSNYYNSLYDALVAKVNLEKALGNIK